MSVINPGIVGTSSAPVCPVSHITCMVSYHARDMPSVCGKEKAPQANAGQYRVDGACKIVSCAIPLHSLAVLQKGCCRMIEKANHKRWHCIARVSLFIFSRAGEIYGAVGCSSEVLALSDDFLLTPFREQGVYSHGDGAGQKNDEDPVGDDGECKGLTKITLKRSWFPDIR
jgi:hypothetical protein